MGNTKVRRAVGMKRACRVAGAARETIWVQTGLESATIGAWLERGTVRAVRLALGVYLLPLIVVMVLLTCLVGLICGGLDQARYLLLGRPRPNPSLDHADRFRRPGTMAPDALCRPYLNN